jgi:aminoglycoside phosphotransferase (APT) family kinase protein
VAAGRMHDDELEADMPLLRRLLAAQFPRWAHLPIERVASAGTDNAVYRLGNDLVARLPRIQWAGDRVDREQRWLPRLAPLLPAAIPVPRGRGVPGESYPWHWSVYSWIEGENPIVGSLADPGALAIDLAEFVNALHAIDPTDGPPAHRGQPLVTRDAPTRAAIEALHGSIAADVAAAAWQEALQTAEWPGPAAWVHGDLSPGNVLVAGGRLRAVIDFGGAGLGDPACDLLVAWNLLPPDARSAFRSAVRVDDATWARGRGWALSVALIQLPYYRDSNPELAANARHVIGEVCADHQRER